MVDISEPSWTPPDSVVRDVAEAIRYRIYCQSGHATSAAIVALAASPLGEAIMIIKRMRRADTVESIAAMRRNADAFLERMGEKNNGG